MRDVKFKEISTKIGTTFTIMITRSATGILQACIDSGPGSNLSWAEKSCQTSNSSNTKNVGGGLKAEKLKQSNKIHVERHKTLSRVDHP